MHNYYYFFFYYILQITLQIIAIIVSVLPPFIQAIKWTYWSVHYLICTADDVLALLVWKIYIISVILLDGLCVTPPHPPHHKSLIFISEGATTKHLFWAKLSIPLLASETFTGFFVANCSQLMPRRLHYSGCASLFAFNSS